MGIHQQIDDLVASPAFAEAVRGAGLHDVRIKLHNSGHGGIAYITGMRDDGLPFDLEMVMSDFFAKADPTRAVVDAVLYDLRLVPRPSP